MSFVPNVEADQKRSNLLDDPRILELATVQSAHPWNLACQSAHPFGGVFVVAAHNHVTINRAVAEQYVRGRIVKGGGQLRPLESVPGEAQF